MEREMDSSAVLWAKLFDSSVYVPTLTFGHEFRVAT